NPAVPVLAGLTPLVQRTAPGSAFALFAIDTPGLQLLEITGAGATTSGAYTLHIAVGGDVDGNRDVDGLHAAAIRAARGRPAGPVAWPPTTPTAMASATAGTSRSWPATSASTPTGRRWPLRARPRRTRTCPSPSRSPA